MKSLRLDSPWVDASVARAVQPIVVPGPDIAAGGAVVESDGAAVAGNKSRYLKGIVMPLIED